MGAGSSNDRCHSGSSQITDGLGRLSAFDDASRPEVTDAPEARKGSVKFVGCGFAGCQRATTRSTGAEPLSGD
jgi:hypothetical protein